MDNTNISIGSIVSDGIVTAQVLARGEAGFGCKWVPAYRVRILSGHERGRESVMVAADTRAVETKGSK